MTELETVLLALCVGLIMCMGIGAFLLWNAHRGWQRALDGWDAAEDRARFWRETFCEEMRFRESECGR